MMIARQPRKFRLENRDRDNELYEEIALRVKQARRQVGMNQEHLAEELGVSRGWIANVETARSTIDVQYILDMATILGCRPMDLLPSSWRDR